MSAALEADEVKIVDSLILRLGDLAIKAGFSATLIYQKFRKSKTESTPIGPRLAFYGEIESVEHESLGDGRLAVQIILKEKAAQ